VMELCKSYKNGTQELRLVRKAKKEVPQYVHAAGVILQGKKVLLAQRPSNGLLGGMWEFPNGRVKENPAKGLTKVLKAEYGLKVQKREPLHVVQHAYTHFKVTVHAYLSELSASSDVDNLKWVSVRNLDKYPMGKVDRKIAQKLSDFLEHK